MRPVSEVPKLSKRKRIFFVVHALLLGSVILVSVLPLGLRFPGAEGEYSPNKLLISYVASTGPDTEVVGGIEFLKAFKVKNGIKLCGPRCVSSGIVLKNIDAWDLYGYPDVYATDYVVRGEFVGVSRGKWGPLPIFAVSSWNPSKYLFMGAHHMGVVLVNLCFALYFVILILVAVARRIRHAART
jgi:hypothetical protein